MKHLIVCLSAIVAFMSLSSCNGGISREDLNGTWLSCQVIDDGQVLLCGQHSAIPPISIIFDDDRVGLRFFAITHWGTYQVQHDKVIATFPGKSKPMELLIYDQSKNSITLFFPKEKSAVRFIRLF